MQYDYLDFDVGDFPQTFEHTFNGVSFMFRIYYNRANDSFYIDTWDENNVMIVAGEKLVYGEPLWSAINDQRLPLVEIIPLDPNGQESVVSASNFPIYIKLCFAGEEENDDVVDDDDLSMTDDTDTSDEDDTTADDADINVYGNDPTVGGEGL